MNERNVLIDDVLFSLSLSFEMGNVEAVASILANRCRLTERANQSRVEQ